MYKQYYNEFLESHKDKIHMAAHSHHFWPDVARNGHIESYENSLKHSDNKWGYIFETLVPEVKQIISSQIKFSRAADISFASNTHELIVKVISSFFEQDKIKILTTKSEFHSLFRQLKRFEEDQKFEITYLDNELDSFDEDLEQTLKNNQFDLIILSHVFFNSGRVLAKDLILKVIELKNNAHFILDAYHGYCAIPTDISSYEDDIFYLAGGYKYAQAGEGMCFMTIPKDCTLRPQITGWFASFSTLESMSSSNRIEYDNDGMRFWGSTMDFTAFFRFRAVWNHFNQKNLSVEKIDQYIKSLQTQFINNNPLLDKIINTDLATQGHFITLELQDFESTKYLNEELLKRNILTDFRGNRLRFGLAPYLNQDEVETVKKQLSSLN